MKSNVANQIKEIDLIALIKTIWSKRKFLIWFSSIFFAIGVIIALTSPVEYRASCRLFPEAQENLQSNLGGLSGLAGLAGINLDAAGSSTLSPALYPEMVGSITFQREILTKQVYFSKIDSTMNSLDYFSAYGKKSLLENIINTLKSIPRGIKQIFKSTKQVAEVSYPNELSAEEWILIADFAERNSVVIDPNTGIIMISTIMPDPVAASMLNDTLVSMLTEKVTNYKLEKAIVNVDFIEQRYFEAKQNYEEKQRSLAQFNDRNINITTAVVQIENQRLQNELNIAFEVYKGLASQLEQAKIKVKEETPIFTVLDRAYIPIEKFKPKRSLIVVVFTFFGLLIATFRVIIKELL